MGELGEARREEERLDGSEEQGKRDGERRALANLRQVDGKQDGGHEHGDRDGQAVRRLHALGAAEEQHHAHAADPQDVVDQRDVDLALVLGGVVDLHVGHEVEADGLAHDGIAARDERLAGDDGGQGGQQHREDAHGAGQHLEERVHGVAHGDKLGVGVVGNDPGALPQVVEDEAGLHDGPAGVDV